MTEISGEYRDNRCIPVLSTSGTYFDVGYSIGSTFSQKIHLYFNESILVQEKLLPFYDSKKGRNAYEEYLSTAEKNFPQYISEIKGTAEGSGMPFEHIFLLNISKEVYKFHFDYVMTDRVIETGCSDVYINRPDLHLLVHNEDCDPLYKKYGYVVNAKIIDVDFQCPEQNADACEQFTAFTYSGSLSGTAFGFNKNGFAITINGLCPNVGIEGATTRFFLNRALLSISSIEDAVRIIKNKGYGCAYGFCANIVTAKNPGQMWSIEVGPGKVESQFHLHKVPEVKEMHKNCHYFHFNSYKHLDVKENNNMKSSQYRKEAAESFPPPRTLKDVKAILGDTSNLHYPLFRTPRGTDPGETVSTTVFDLDKSMMYIYMDNPSFDPDPVLSLSLQ